MGEHAPYAGLREEVRSSAPRLAVARSVGLRPGARVAELFAARDALLGDETLEHELARRYHRPRVFFRRQADLIHQVEQPRHHAESLETRLRALVAGDLERPALVEPVDDVVYVGPAHAGFERLARGPPDQVFRDHFGSLQLTFVFELELTGDGGERGVDVGHARDHRFLLRGDGAPLRARHDVLEDADRQPLRHTGAAVHPLVLAGLERHALDQLRDKGRELDGAPIALQPGLLARNRRSQI